MTTLRGITWDHTRGLLPLVATAQRFHELQDVDVLWERRSLKAFGDEPLSSLADTYDLLIIDHPFVGHAASEGSLVPLDDHVPTAYLDEQASNSVGQSHASYRWRQRSWALATDAATPVAAYRPDLLEHHGVGLPRAWEDLMELARAGLVLVPGAPIDSLMTYYFLLVSSEVAIFEEGRFAEPDAAETVLRRLKELFDSCSPECLSRNPIRTYEALATTDAACYCPHAYAYSNYGRRGFAANVLGFAPPVEVVTGAPVRTTLGGTGMAVSARSQHRDLALRYLQYVHEAQTQRTLYVDAGGQPGHRSAWLDAESDRVTNGFFLATLDTHDHAYLRPRYNGYHHFQDAAAQLVHAFLRGERTAAAVVEGLGVVYRQSLVSSEGFEGRDERPASPASGR